MLELLQKDVYKRQEYSLEDKKEEQQSIDVIFDLKDFYKKFKEKHQNADNIEKSDVVQKDVYKRQVVVRVPYFQG